MNRSAPAALEHYHTISTNRRLAHQMDVITPMLIPTLQRLYRHGGRMTTRQLQRSGTFDEVGWAWLKDSLRQMVERGWLTATQTTKNQITYEITEAGYRALVR